MLAIWEDCLGGFDNVINYCTNLVREAGDLLVRAWSSTYLVDPILCTTFLTANCHTEGSLAGRAAYSPDRHVAARLLRDTSKADNNTNCPELSLPEQLLELKKALMRPLAKRAPDLATAS